MTLYPPSDYQEDASDGAAPDQKLKLGWVYLFQVNIRSFSYSNPFIICSV